MPFEETTETQCTLVVLTAGGFLKRVRLEEFEIRRRGGKGVVGGKPGEEDVVFSITSTQPQERVFLFTNLGMCHTLQSDEIPLMSRYARGRKVASFLSLAPDERVTFILSHGGALEDQPLVLVSARGVTKRTSLSNFKRQRAGGTIAMKLSEGDTIRGGYISAEPGETLIITTAGKVVRFDESSVRVTGKAAQGVRGVTLSGADTVVAVCPATEGVSVLIVSEKGFGKLTAQGRFRKTARGAAGVTGTRLTDKTGKVAFAGTVSRGEVILCSKKGKFIRFRLSDVRETGRAAVGVRLMKIEDDTVGCGTVLAGD